jgi:hypothetical protein
VAADGEGQGAGLKVLLVGDVHLADRPPSIRTEAYSDHILKKLDFLIGVIRDRKPDAVVFAGDVFHVKAPSRTSHALMSDLIFILQQYECPVFVVPGNHDMRHDRLDRLRDQPLGVLIQSDMVMQLSRTDWVCGLPLFGVPWLQDWQKELPQYMDDWQRSSAQLLVTHAPIVKPGEDRPFEVIDATAWASLMSRGGDVYYGHMHDPDGAYEAAPDGANMPFIFCNQGAISRGSLHESTLARKPAVTIYDSELDGVARFERVEVPHRPAAEVFRLTEKNVEDEKTERLDEFLTSIGSTSLEAVSIEKVKADLATRDLPKAVVAEILTCIEEVS